MEKEFSELIEYLDGKFNGIDKRFSGIENKVLGIENKVLGIGSKVFGIEEKIQDLQENKADKDDINNLMGAIDSYAKKADTYFEEMVALSHKVDRHEKWLLQLAEKLGVKLEY